MPKLKSYRFYKDDEKTQDDKKALLQLRIDLNRQYEEDVVQNTFNEDFNIPVPPTKYTTVDEEIKDTILQRDIAFQNLKKITKPDDAFNILTAISNEIPEFNKFFPLFQKDVSNVKNITPTVFEALWLRFKEKIAKTGDTGIIIAPEADEYRAELDELKEGISEIATTTTPANIKEILDKHLELVNYSLYYIKNTKDSKGNYYWDNPQSFASDILSILNPSIDGGIPLVGQKITLHDRVHGIEITKTYKTMPQMSVLFYDFFARRTGLPVGIVVEKNGLLKNATIPAATLKDIKDLQPSLIPDISVIEPKLDVLDVYDDRTKSLFDITFLAIDPRYR